MVPAKKYSARTRRLATTSGLFTSRYYGIASALIATIISCLGLSCNKSSQYVCTIGLAHPTIDVNLLGYTRDELDAFTMLRYTNGYSYERPESVIPFSGDTLFYSGDTVFRDQTRRPFARVDQISRHNVIAMVIPAKGDTQWVFNLTYAHLPHNSYESEVPCKQDSLVTRRILSVTVAADVIFDSHHNRLYLVR